MRTVFSLTWRSSATCLGVMYRWIMAGPFNCRAELSDLFGMVGSVASTSLDRGWGAHCSWRKSPARRVH
ncbi:hypothetical protein SAMN04515671_1085 [Nakamurella panacisegetis]|uniref:Uncharacterized protein n=1 Tax=Nakamurella panacisegetis TaxID=1090615 RepID=A0A1H0JXF6_9ACTN|nr:hypothetical protein SAMN04515671_1085 [Nakamurella panacisegetis]